MEIFFDKLFKLYNSSRRLYLFQKCCILTYKGEKEQKKKINASKDKSEIPLKSPVLPTPPEDPSHSYQDKRCRTSPYWLYFTYYQYRISIVFYWRSYLEDYLSHVSFIIIYTCLYFNVNNELFSNKLCTHIIISDSPMYLVFLIYPLQTIVAWDFATDTLL